MERKEYNSLNEAALQVQTGITPEPEINEAVLEYFSNYFGDNLNEDTSDEDIMQAVYDLIDLTEAVMEAAALSTPEGIRTRITRTNRLHAGLMQKRDKIADSQLDHMNSGNVDALGKNLDRMKKIDKRADTNQDRFSQAQKARHDAEMPVTTADVSASHPRKTWT